MSIGKEDRLPERDGILARVWRKTRSLSDRLGRDGRVGKVGRILGSYWSGEEQTVQKRVLGHLACVLLTLMSLLGSQGIVRNSYTASSLVASIH